MKLTNILLRARTYFGYISHSGLPRPPAVLSSRAPVTLETSMYAQVLPEQPTEAFISELYEFLGRSSRQHAALFRAEETLAHRVDELGAEVVEFPPQTNIRPLILRGHNGTLYVRDRPDILELLADIESQLGPTPMRLVR